MKKEMAGRLRFIVVSSLIVIAACGCDNGCLSDAGGCTDFPVIQISICPEQLAPLPYGQVLASPDDHLGKSILVSGPLLREAGMCTQLGCGFHEKCCNSCGASMMLSDAVSPTYHSASDLILNGSIDEVALACGGDESLMCCPLPTNGSIVTVTGVLVKMGISIDGDLYGIDVESICAVQR